jgi:hypothetical protein
LFRRSPIPDVRGNIAPFFACVDFVAGASAPVKQKPDSQQLTKRLP